MPNNKILKNVTFIILYENNIAIIFLKSRSKEVGPYNIILKRGGECISIHINMVHI
jgi:hypothetical protein